VSVGVIIAALGLATWLYLLAGRGQFWRANVRDDDEAFASPAQWPTITGIVPARNEAEVIGRSLPTLLGQDYSGPFHIVLVDDESDDGTSAEARRTAESDPGRLTILAGAPLPQGWTGKLWAMKQGIDHAVLQPNPPGYLLLTDADIAYEPAVLKRLVARAEAEHLTLASLMVKLRCESIAERALIPGFVFFFQMLYPFAWVNKRDHPIAAAAGGCMLVRRDALERVGGIEAIRASLIDDCALGRQMKRQGAIWLGLAKNARSLRPYPAFDDIRRMVARSAYDQLNYSPLLLIGTVLGLTFTYLMPVWFGVFGEGAGQTFGILTWILMAFAFFPIVHFYKLSPLWALALPGIAALYAVFTVDSAYQHWRGRGGLWKGRVQARGAGVS
jgi:hopene-associated glycosyltransferase HpnB